MIFATFSLLSAGIVETVQIKNTTLTSSDPDLSLWFVTLAPQHIFMGASLVFVIPAGILVYHRTKNEIFLMTQQTITFSKSTVETLKKGVKYV